MAFIIPKWRAYDVQDWDDLLIETAEGEYELNEATAALINLVLLGI
ncbi:MAG: hypothetical protein JSS81_27365 [Acidobacteria bacterium]|nr:hypothetical protein [Acidobacteriota bacterium]